VHFRTLKIDRFNQHSALVFKSYQFKKGGLS